MKAAGDVALGDVVIIVVSMLILAMRAAALAIAAAAQLLPLVYASSGARHVPSSVRVTACRNCPISGIANCGLDKV